MPFSPTETKTTYSDLYAKPIDAELENRKAIKTFATMSEAEKANMRALYEKPYSKPASTPASLPIYKLVEGGTPSAEPLPRPLDTIITDTIINSPEITVNKPKLSASQLQHERKLAMSTPESKRYEQLAALGRAVLNERQAKSALDSAKSTIRTSELILAEAQKAQQDLIEELENK